MKILALLGFVSAFVSQAAMAQTPESTTPSVAYNQLQLVNINTDQFADQTYRMGINLDANRHAVGLFYSNPYQTDPDKQLLNFSFADLASAPQTLITRSGHDIVKISYGTNELTILYNRNATNNHSWSNKLYRVACDSDFNNCNVIDESTNIATRDIYISSHRVAFITVGIDTIVSH